MLTHRHLHCTPKTRFSVVFKLIFILRATKISKMHRKDAVSTTTLNSRQELVLIIYSEPDGQKSPPDL